MVKSPFLVTKSSFFKFLPSQLRSCSAHPHGSWSICGGLRYGLLRTTISGQWLSKKDLWQQQPQEFRGLRTAEREERSQVAGYPSLTQKMVVARHFAGVLPTFSGKKPIKPDTKKIKEKALEGCKCMILRLQRLEVESQRWEISTVSENR